jgi:superfamily II DNA or RNA helicase
MIKRKTFNELITPKIIDSWKQGKGIILNGGTGTGKTYFIIHNLAEKCLNEGKKILYLCNRTALFDKVLKEVKANFLQDNIDVRTYQWLEAMINNGKDIKTYDYIVADECHYFMSDSWNDFTDISYKFLISQLYSIVVFMSATANDVFGQIQTIDLVDKENIYIIKKDYSYVKNIELMFQPNAKDTIIETTIEHLLNETDDKIIFFCKSLKYGFELYQKFKENAYLYCSQNKKNDKYLPHATLDCIKENEEDKTITFEKRLLITTSALDNGIDIIDRNVKHLITDIWDFDIMVQCLGRKRHIDNADWCNFYIRNYSNKQLGNIKGGLGTILNPAKVFKDDINKFKDTYLKNDRQFHNTLLYNDPKSTELKLNLVKFNKMKIDYKTLDKWIEKNYKYYLVCLFDVYENKIQVVDSKMSHELSKEEILIKYIDSIVGIRLFEPERKELIEYINLRDGRNRLQKTPKLFNAYFEANKYPFMIISKQVRIENKKISVWIVEKLILDK